MFDMKSVDNCNKSLGSHVTYEAKSRLRVWAELKTIDSGMIYFSVHSKNDDSSGRHAYSESKSTFVCRHRWALI